MIDRLVGGLKVGMSFADASNIEWLQTNAEWIKVTDNGRREGNPNLKWHGTK